LVLRQKMATINQNKARLTPKVDKNNMSNYREIVLAHYCQGIPKLSDFEIIEKPIPEPEEGEFRLRHIWNSVDPGTRGRLSGVASYSPPLGIGSPIESFSVGVIEKSRHPSYPEGMYVAVGGGWKTHSIQTGEGYVVPISGSARALPLSYWIGVLCVPGLTGWFGLKNTQFKQHDQVLISSAAGPVGATAGQLAKAWGAKRVVGIAGADEKCDWLVNEAGFDAAINYKTTDDLDAQIRQTMPDGVDLLFDNVGNDMVNRVLPMMNLNGRICISGQVADYNLPLEDTPGIVNTKYFITHRLTMRGLLVFDYAAEFGDTFKQLAGLIATDKLNVKEERYQGIETTAEAFCGLFTNQNFGRRVVQVSDEE